MSEHDIQGDPDLQSLDPGEMRDATESGELERPQLRRKIDCSAASETDGPSQAQRPGKSNRNAR